MEKAGAKQVANAAEILADLRTADGSLPAPAVDLRLDADLVLPQAVADEAARAAHLLARLSAAPNGTAAWRSYHQKFYERYGRGALVPLLDMVADSGIGWPDGHATPPSTSPAARLPAMSAIRGLEPIVNLARLHIRAGHHQHGHQLLLNLYRAVTTATETTLDGITVPARLTENDQHRGEVRQWLWRVVIADGTRALTSAGRWGEALRHIEEHRGIGRRILDGRQTAVLAAATTGDLSGALALLEDTEPGDPWEDAVTALLTALCRPGERHADAAIGHCLIFEPGPKPAQTPGQSNE